jgi:tripartite-type tricarboxylate transporter receptor subunit TctC
MTQNVYVLDWSIEAPHPPGTTTPVPGQAMELQRRSFLLLAAGVAGLSIAGPEARAGSYPSRPVRIIVGFPPGGPADIHARLAAKWLTERLGQPFIVENKPGAGGNLGTEAVVHAPADGYTLLLVGTSQTINATLYDALSFNLTRDLAPVAGLIRNGLIMLVNPAVPARTVSEFIEHVQLNPGKINMGSGGIGTPSHVTGELFKSMTKVDMLHVPYRGEAPAIAALIGGQIQAMFSTMDTSIEHVRSGRLRALAVTSAIRSDALPGIETVGDVVSDFEATAWVGLAAPKGTPREIIEMLNREINAGLSSPDIKARYADLNATALTGSPEDFGTLIAGEIAKWSRVIRSAGIRLE